VALPTSQWGNPSDVYPTVPTQGDGPVIGNWQMYFVDGSTIQFVQNTSAGAIAASAALRLSTGNWQTTYQVLPTSAVTQYVVGANDQSLISVAASYCLWMKTRGLMFPLVATGQTGNTMVGSSSTAGQLATVTLANAATIQYDLLLTATTSANAAAPVYRSQ
jgi:hypothetical protein